MMTNMRQPLYYTRCCAIRAHGQNINVCRLTHFFKLVDVPNKLPSRFPSFEEMKRDFVEVAECTACLHNEATSNLIHQVARLILNFP